MRNLVTKVYAWGQAHNADEEGQTVIEYALVTAVISIALIILMAGFGSGIIGDAKNKLDNYIT